MVYFIDGSRTGITEDPLTIVVGVEHGHQVFAARKDVDVALIGIFVPWQPLVGLARDRGERRLHPSLKGPLPEPKSYERVSCGPTPDRPGDVGIATVIEPVPMTGLAPDFSPIPRMAPPPLGSEIDGGRARPLGS